MAVIDGKHLQPRPAEMPRTGTASDQAVDRSIDAIEKLAGPPGPEIVPHDLYGNAIGRPADQEVPLPESGQ
jgi:hypothetical protein